MIALRLTIACALAIGCGGLREDRVAADAGVDVAAPDASPDAEIDAGAAACPYVDAAPDVGVPACSRAERAKRFAAAYDAPAIPLVSAFGIRIPPAGAPPLTLADVETVLCQPQAQGDLFGDGTWVATWGDNAEIWGRFDCALRLTSFSCWHGCSRAPLAFHSADGAHAFSLAILSAITKDGQPYLLDWTDPVKLGAEMDEIFDALRATFAPSIHARTCASTVPPSCTTATFGNTGAAYLDFPSLGVTIWVANANAGQPTSSIPNRIDIGPPR